MSVDTVSHLYDVAHINQQPLNNTVTATLIPHLQITFMMTVENAAASLSFKKCVHWDLNPTNCTLQSMA